MAENNPMLLAVMMVGIGGFALVGGIMNWNWYMNHRKAHFMTKLLGQNGARLFYIILGSVAFVAGLLLATGVIGPNGG